jgi:hypothetical protein
MSQALKHPWQDLRNAIGTNNAAVALLVSLIGFLLAAIVVLVITAR